MLCCLQRIGCDRATANVSILCDCRADHLCKTLVAAEMQTIPQNLITVATRKFATDECSIDCSMITQFSSGTKIYLHCEAPVGAGDFWDTSYGPAKVTMRSKEKYTQMTEPRLWIILWIKREISGYHRLLNVFLVNGRFPALLAPPFWRRCRICRGRPQAITHL